VRRPATRVCLVVLAAVAILCSAPAASGAGVLVALLPGQEATKLLAAAGGELVSSGLSLWKLDSRSAREVVPVLERRGLLRYTEPNRSRELQGFADAGDPLVADAWHLERIGALGLDPPGPGVPLALIDSLIDAEYPELAARPGTMLLSEHTSCSGNDTPHATIVAAIGAAPANGEGTVGVYPTAELWSVNACSLDDADIIEAIDAAASRRPSVITLPLGGPGYSRPLYEAILRAIDRGSLVVAAAGNYFQAGDPTLYPARYPHVLTVGSLDREDRPSSFSSSGVDVAAPGDSIPVLDPEKPAETLSVSGTSFATPVVAAAAAWLWTVNPALDSTQVDSLLRTSAKDVLTPGVDPRTGFGRLDLPAALGAAAPAADPLEPNDDVDLVAPGGIVSAKAPLRSGSDLEARLDPAEDPRDLYRVVVPAGKRFVARARASSAGVRIALWHPKTVTVTRDASQYRLAAASVPAGGTRSISFRNTSGRAMTLFVELKPRGKRVEYDLRARIRP
jgi:subtilisin family serine protease